MSNLFDSIRERLGYVLSLPERTLRSLAAVTGGATSLLTETLFPESMRETTLYRFFIGDAQRYLVERVAQVQTEAGGAVVDSTDPSYVQRKMLGGALETAGLLAMHLSPLWVFALASDVAGGGGVALARLTERLKRNGVIPKHTEIRGVSDLLVAIQEASRQSASAVDTPPLSREELKRLGDDMTARYRELFSKVRGVMPKMEDIWHRMQEVAKRENISLERLGGILSVDVANWAKKGFGTILSVGQTGNDLFGEQVLDSYSRTLDEISREGAGKYVSGRLRPFIRKAADHFDPGHKTWTEAFLERIEQDDVTVQDPVDKPTPEWPATDVVDGPDPENPPCCNDKPV